MIKLIVGLGNPGSQYEKTRHNAGFVFLDSLIAGAGGKWAASSQFQAEVADMKVSHFAVKMAKPMTFMNRSGLSVGGLMRYYKLAPEELLVVHDELELPEGEVRLKKGGGHAGHNGLRDIIAHLDSRDFYRLRLGIGRPSIGSDVAGYVLSKPSAQVWQGFERVFADLSEKMGVMLVGDVAGFNALLVGRH